MLPPCCPAAGFIVGFISGILGVTGTGIGVNWDPNDVAGSFSGGANWAWYGSNYDWRPFLAALLCSSCTLLAWCTVAWLLRKRFGIKGPGISGIVMRIPGAKWVTATPHWNPDTSVPDAPLKSHVLPLSVAEGKSMPAV